MLLNEFSADDRWTKLDTRLRKAVPPDVRLAVFLFYMATGLDQRHVAMIFDVARSLVSDIEAKLVDIFRCAVLAVAPAAFLCLSPAPSQTRFVAACPYHCPPPPTPQKPPLTTSDKVYRRYVKLPLDSDLQIIARNFQQRHKLPNCIGALDGTFFHIESPSQNNRAFFCYKKYYAIAILAIADTDYKFWYFNTGGRGGAGDAFLWNTSQFCRDLHTTRCYDLDPFFVTPAGNVVANSTRSNGARRVDSYLVADSAFSLTARCIKVDPAPNPARHVANFNRRVTNCRRVVEQAFARFSGRWGVVKWNHINDIDCATKTSKAAAALHNICQQRAVPFFASWAAARNAVRQAQAQSRQQLQQARRRAQQPPLNAAAATRLDGELTREALQWYCKHN